jgi:hypothetical protein
MMVNVEDVVMVENLHPVQVEDSCDGGKCR